MSKRRKGFPSETKVKRGVRIVHGGKELTEKLGRNDLCPCESGKRFKKCCLKKSCFRRREPGPLLLGTDNEAHSIQGRVGFFRIVRCGYRGSEPLPCAQLAFPMPLVFDPLHQERTIEPH